MNEVIDQYADDPFERRYPCPPTATSASLPHGCRSPDARAQVSCGDDSGSAADGSDRVSAGAAGAGGGAAAEGELQPRRPTGTAAAAAACSRHDCEDECENEEDVLGSVAAALMDLGGGAGVFLARAAAAAAAAGPPRVHGAAAAPRPAGSAGDASDVDAGSCGDRGPQASGDSGPGASSSSRASSGGRAFPPDPSAAGPGAGAAGAGAAAPPARGRWAPAPGPAPSAPLGVELSPVVDAIRADPVPVICNRLVGTYDPTTISITVTGVPVPLPPTYFEVQAGASKTKKWRESCKVGSNGLALGAYLATLGLNPSWATSRLAHNRILATYALLPSDPRVEAGLERAAAGGGPGEAVGCYVAVAKAPGATYYLAQVRSHDAATGATTVIFLEDLHEQCLPLHPGCWAVLTAPSRFKLVAREGFGPPPWDRAREALSVSQAPMPDEMATEVAKRLAMVRSKAAKEGLEVPDGFISSCWYTTRRSGTVPGAKDWTYRTCEGRSVRSIGELLLMLRDWHRRGGVVADGAAAVRHRSAMEPGAPVFTGGAHPPAHSPSSPSHDDGDAAADEPPLAPPEPPRSASPFAAAPPPPPAAAAPRAAPAPSLAGDAVGMGAAYLATLGSAAAAAAVADADAAVRSSAHDSPRAAAALAAAAAPPRARPPAPPAPPAHLPLSGARGSPVSSLISKLWPEGAAPPAALAPAPAPGPSHPAPPPAGALPPSKRPRFGVAARPGGAGGGPPAAAPPLGRGASGALASASAALPATAGHVQVSCRVAGSLVELLASATPDPHQWGPLLQLMACLGSGALTAPTLRLVATHWLGGWAASPQQQRQQQQQLRRALAAAWRAAGASGDSLHQLLTLCVEIDSAQRVVPPPPPPALDDADALAAAVTALRGVAAEAAALRVPPPDLTLSVQLLASCGGSPQLAAAALRLMHAHGLGLLPATWVAVLGVNSPAYAEAVACLLGLMACGGGGGGAGAGGAPVGARERGASVLAALAAAAMLPAPMAVAAPAAL